MKIRMNLCIKNKRVSTKSWELLFNKRIKLFRLIVIELITSKYIRALYVISQLVPRADCTDIEAFRNRLVFITMR